MNDRKKEKKMKRKSEHINERKMDIHCSAFLDQQV